MSVNQARRGIVLVVTITTLAMLAATTLAVATSSASAFMTETHAAMTRMMTAMDVQPSGDVDHDFAAMMIPHHQGAIDMAMVELRYGRDEQLRRLAQEIVIAQQQEIVVMQRALVRPAGASGEPHVGHRAP